MKIKVFADEYSVAQEAAAIIAAEAREAVADRGRFVMALSGGRTPWAMLRSLIALDVPWERVLLAQVDERVAPVGDPLRNLTHISEILLQNHRIDPKQVYAMPVEEEDLSSAASRYATILREIAGAPPVLDLVHLGLGPDGHTASLLPEDPVLEITGEDVALTGLYQGTRRMTLTYPIINRSRMILWLVTGGEKTEVVERLWNGDQSIPCGRIRRDNSLILADTAAAGQLG
ncbi:MAG: 6-phosphogluconolactonase [Desulfomonilaceae bacterium]|jgi:6-phosphogluconolactonase